MALSAKLGGPAAKLSAEFTPLSEHNWGPSRAQIKILRVVKQPKVERVVETPTKPVHITSPDGKTTIKIVYESYGRRYEVKNTSTLRDTFRAFGIAVKLPWEDLKFHHHSRSLEPSDTPLSLNLPPTVTLSASLFWIKFSLCDSLTGVSNFIRMKHGALMNKVFKLVKTKLGDGCPHGFRLYDQNRIPIDPNATAEETYKHGGTELQYEVVLVGGKPVIYLFPPRQLEATVRLSLSPSWRFDAVYPLTLIEDNVQSGQQTIVWETEATPEGNLRDRASNIELTYLFWEAKTVSKLHHGGMAELRTFEPGQTRCEPENSAVLPVQTITQYIDRALGLLGLHTSARTDFITYWLPRFLQYKYIALRFVSQDAYEKAATLDITPKPDIVTRVFMLFQGIPEADLSAWTEATTRGTEDAGFWRAVVGTDPVKQQDLLSLPVLTTSTQPATLSSTVLSSFKHVAYASSKPELITQTAAVGSW
ncbi:hypothetical protein FRB90_007077 [Tulasnella sp. 427]|nr:hypothetical protein FRB90_007077 [Tulasnella sp. 427]